MSTDTLNAAEVDLSDPALWESGREELLRALALLRRERPVSLQPAPTVWAPQQWEPRPYWAVTRHADIQAISRYPATFSNARGVGFAMDRVPPSHVLAGEGFMAMDPPRHSRLRRLVSKTFTPRMMRTIDGFIQDQAELAISRVAERGECDFLHDLVAPFPFGVICDMLGVPREDHEWMARAVDLVDEDQQGDGSGFMKQLVESSEILCSYGADLARTRRADLREDLVSALIDAEVDGDRLTDEEIGSIFVQLILAGTETTAGTSCFGMDALTAFPDERRRWQADYEGLAGSAIEEILRWSTVIPVFRRTATVDVELGGEQISAGDTVALFYLSGSFDETVFDEPNRFDVTRDSSNHLAFGGGGIHFCLGNALARTEMRALFRELFKRLPDIQITEGVVPIYSPLVVGFHALPCSYTPVRAYR